LFEEALGRMSRCYGFDVVGYVVMPEHVHLLVSEPAKGKLAVGLQALKLSVAKRAGQRPFWQARYYEFNVFAASKRFEIICMRIPSSGDWWSAPKIGFGPAPVTT
jgi:putative transposase